MTGRLLFYTISLFALIDLSAIHSFVAKGAVEKLGLKPTLVNHISLEMSNGDKILSDNMLFYQAIKGQELIVDLIVFKMPDFDMFLRMDFLSKCGAKINCKKKKVKFNLENGILRFKDQVCVP